MLPADFVCGFQWYLDALPSMRETAPRIVTRVLVEHLEITALVDTGANQCVIGWSVAQQLGDAAGLGLPQARALGGNVHQGVRFPVVVTFVADEGESVSLETAAWSAESFSGPNLIGYGGLLEKLHFALDPATNRMFFGQG